MMSFSELCIPIFEEDRYYIMKNGIPYGIDKNNQEYEITPGMVNEYYNKNGGRWRPKAKMIGGHLVGGALLGIPMMVGTDTIIRPFSDSGGQVAAGLALGFSSLYGRMQGLKHEQNRVYNDIAKQRRDQL